jgi:hypothetical protein
MKTSIVMPNRTSSTGTTILSTIFGTIAFITESEFDAPYTIVNKGNIEYIIYLH